MTKHIKMRKTFGSREYCPQNSGIQQVVRNAEGSISYRFSPTPITVNLGGWAKPILPHCYRSGISGMPIRTDRWTWSCNLRRRAAWCPGRSEDHRSRDPNRNRR